MHRDLRNLLAIMVISSVAGAATNVFAHKMDWIRRPLPASKPAETEPGEVVPAPRESSVPLQPANGTKANHEPPGQNGQPVATQQRENGMTAETVLEYLTNSTACFIDAREAPEYAAGHLRGAVNVPSSAIWDNIEKVRSLISPDHRVVVYCGGGGCEASHNVSDVLQRDYEFKNVLIYDNGWEEIESSGLFKDWIAEGEQP
jgi:rhodanese-related sulfurtransferase